MPVIFAVGPSTFTLGNEKNLITKFILLCILLSAGPVQANTQYIDIWAEEFEPLSYKSEQGEIVGMNTELVKALVAEAGIEVRHWEIVPWARAFKEAKETPNSLVYTIARTPEREDLFHWVGPIGHRKIALYKLKSNKHLAVNQWSDLKNIRIGSLLGSASSASLKQQNLKLYEVSHLKQIVRMLLQGRIDLANMMNFSLAYLAREEGLNYSDFEQVWVVDDTTHFYLALNKETSLEIVAALQSAFVKYEKEGKLAKLHEKYLSPKNTNPLEQTARAAQH